MAGAGASAPLRCRGADSSHSRLRNQQHSDTSNHSSVGYIHAAKPGRQLNRLNSTCFDVLWTCCGTCSTTTCTANPHLDYCTQLVVRQIHNKSK